MFYDEFMYLSKSLEPLNKEPLFDFNTSAISNLETNSSSLCSMYFTAVDATSTTTGRTEVIYGCKVLFRFQIIVLCRNRERLNFE